MRTAPASGWFGYAGSLVIQISDAAPAVDTEALRRELEAKLEGEVRFDAVSRALYSTDASVYQIHPVGVVVPRNREDILRALEICRRLRCSITLRGGGTSQAGQAITLRAEMDLIVGLTACSAEKSNNYRFKPIGFEITPAQWEENQLRRLRENQCCADPSITPRPRLGRHHEGCSDPAT